MLKLLCTFAFAVLALGQTPPISLRNVACASPTEPLVALTIPVNVSTVVIPVPVCVGLGPGLRLNSTSTKIEIDPAALPSLPAVSVPRQVVHTVVLGNLPQQPGISTVQFNLSFAPAPGTYLVTSYTSSRVGGDVLDFVPFAGGDQPKSVTLTLPAHRPLLTTDVVKILYWTLEPPPA